MRISLVLALAIILNISPRSHAQGIDPDGDTTPAFSMDGLVDSSNYLVIDNGMRIWAAVKGTRLYFATWSSEGGTSDHFLLLNQDFGNPEPHPWSKAGQLNFFFGGWPWLAGEGDSGTPFHTLNNGGTTSTFAMGTNGNVLEGEVNLIEVFGSVPETIYLTALSYGDNDGDGILGQAPVAWSSDNDLQITEMAAINTKSIRDSDLDGYHDGGAPTFETDSLDANYGLRRFYIDELANQTDSISFTFQPNINPSESITSAELVTNLNRRDQASIDDDRATATTSSTSYYRAYPMTENAGTYTATIPVEKCGAYRATVRYYIDGAGPYFYTDSAQRRDLAIVASPTKSRTINLYEVNPATVEATAATEAGRSTFRDLWTANTDRPDIVNLDHFTNLGVNMLWLQPIHPVGIEGRQTDPTTSSPYEPGSPYSVRDYWKITPALGAANTDTSAMSEFQTAVAQFDTRGIGIMMDGTFNHSAPDAVLGSGAEDLFPWAAGQADTQIRNLRPQWFSKIDNYHIPAANASEIATAPDRSDFGKFTDVRELYFGDYDTLVKFPDASHRQSFLLERDAIAPLDADTRDLWEYFAEYPIYWLEQTGHPIGTPMSESEKGIDGLRCDFAQGLPSQFWEYCINRTRSVKWNFLFMAESLDGFREVAGDKRHGVGYRSARHFDILNENMVFHWRDTHFAYPAGGPGSGGTADRSTGATFNALNERRDAYEDIVLLQNLTSHDEVLPSNDPYELLQAYAQQATLDGIPMLFFGQEAGLQNDVNAYGFTGISNADHNFTRYELNFGKSIPHFKAWNAMGNVWSNRDFNLQNQYGKINQARLDNPLLQSPNNFFLSPLGSSSLDPSIFAIAKYDTTGLLLCFVNTDYQADNTRSNTFDLSPTELPIDPTRDYNLTNLLANDPTAQLWATDRTGADLIANGLAVNLDDPIGNLGQLRYYRLIDTSVPPDTDADGMPDAYEIANGLDETDPTDATEDADSDGQNNLSEFIAGTDPQDATSLLALANLQLTSQTSLEVTWSSIPEKEYQLQRSTDLENWSTEPTTITATTPSTTTTLTNPQFPREFIRIKVVTP